MPNLGDFLTAIGLMTGDGSEFVAATGAAIGLLADASGAISLLVDIITGSVGSSDDLHNQLTEFEGRVVDLLNHISETLIAGQIQTFRMNSTSQLGLAEKWVGEIHTDALHNRLPLPQFEADKRQADCEEALFNLLDESYWKLSPDDQQYFQPENPWRYEGWAAINDPNSIFYFPFFYHDKPDDVYSLRFVQSFKPETQGGYVFSYVLALQASFRALYDYLAVCSTGVPDFPDDGSSYDHLVNFVEKLLFYHDKIVDGIVNIIPPGPMDLTPCGRRDDQFVTVADASKAPSIWQVATVRFTEWPGYMRGTLTAPSSEYTRPFGALCNYTGYVANYNSTDPAAPPSVDNYPTYSLPARYDGWYWAEMPDGKQWYIGFYGKYLLRSFRRKKDVYRGIGLPVVWDVINKIRSLYGMTPVLRKARSHEYASNFRDWSLREVFQLLGASTGNPLLTKISVRALAEFLKNAAPEMAHTPTSLRQMFEA